MFEPETLVPKKPRALVTGPPPRPAEDLKQRRLMVVTLALLLVTLGGVLYWDRGFWFPDRQEAELDEPATATPTTTAAGTATRASGSLAKSKSHGPASTAPAAKAAPSAAQPGPAPVIAATRTVLPPLEVEVVAGDTHRTVRPGSNSVRVDLQPGAPPVPASENLTVSNSNGTAADVTNPAAERVEMSADTTDVVSRTVKPGYPLLARQMKVQGSVILRALISRDGAIQDLHVLSGPTILASAAQAAVRQWRFKPHYLGSEAVETQAKITVNFTISTN
jgi:TonB family protein